MAITEMVARCDGPLADKVAKVATIRTPNAADFCGCCYMLRASCECREFDATGSLELCAKEREEFIARVAKKIDR